MATINRVFLPLLLVVVSFLSIPDAAIAKSQLPGSILPDGFNPNTCEAERAPPPGATPEELSNWRGQTGNDQSAHESKGCPR